MLSLEQFRKRYSYEIYDYMLNELQVSEAYKCYIEDPTAFHPNMISQFQ